MTISFYDLPTNIQNDILEYASPWKETYKQVIKEIIRINTVVYPSLADIEYAHHRFVNIEYNGDFFNDIVMNMIIQDEIIDIINKDIDKSKKKYNKFKSQDKLSKQYKRKSILKNRHLNQPLKNN